jgi:hypothetical protein
LFKLIDQYGLPVSNYPVTFKTVTGGQITDGDPTTDIYGLAGAVVNLGSQPGDQIFTGSAGGLTVEFDGTARALPTITNVAGAVPGALATINGRFLSDATKIVGSGPPAVQLAGVSVSFEGTSIPGMLTSVSPSQITVQVPVDLAGQTSVRMKVRVGEVFGPLFTVTLSNPAAAGGSADAETGRQVAATARKITH